MNLTATAPLKPLSAIQRKVIGIQTRRFGCSQPFRQGLMPDGREGIAVNPGFAFARLPTKRLSEEELAKLAEDGIVLHTFDPHLRQLAFTFSYEIWEGRGLTANLAVDAIDLQKANTVGTMGLSIDLSMGVADDRQVVRAPLSETARRFLSMHNYNPDRVFSRREELTDDGFSLFGRVWVNLKVEEAYRNRGKEGVYGIAQILMTTALRLAAEQFLVLAYIMSAPTEAHCGYYRQILGAERSVRFPTYAFHHVMICSFSGPAGVEIAENILEQKHHEALCDWD